MKQIHANAILAQAECQLETKALDIECLHFFSQPDPPWDSRGVSWGGAEFAPGALTPGYSECAFTALGMRLGAELHVCFACWEVCCM